METSPTNVYIDEWKDDALKPYSRALKGMIDNLANDVYSKFDEYFSEPDNEKRAKLLQEFRLLLSSFSQPIVQIPFGKIRLSRSYVSKVLENVKLDAGMTREHDPHFMIVTFWNACIKEKSSSVSIADTDSLTHMLGFGRSNTSSIHYGGKNVGSYELDIPDESPDFTIVFHIFDYYISKIHEVLLYKNSLVLRAIVSHFQLDPLTKLYNRATYEAITHNNFGAKNGTTVWSEIVDHIQPRPETVAFSILDIDNFKSFNDEYGHAVGDIVLANTARICQESAMYFSEKKKAEGKDISIIIARLGGEEVEIIIRSKDGNVDKDLVTQFNAYLLKQIRENKLYNAKDESNPLSVTASLGTRIVDLADEHEIEAIKKYGINEQKPGSQHPIAGYGSHMADHAMYEAKRAGRDRFIIADKYTPIKELTPEEKQIQTLSKSNANAWRSVPVNRGSYIQAKSITDKNNANFQALITQN